MGAPLRIEEEQALFFRAKRAGFVEPKRTALIAARDNLGAQSQQLGPSLHGLSLRTRSRPKAVDLAQEIHSSRKLVRTWGQRDTVHAYATQDWATWIAARSLWSGLGRRGVMPTEGAVAKALALLKKIGEPATRSDLFGITPKSMVREAEEKIGRKGDAALRIAAGRFFWILAQRGEVSFADKKGSEQYFALRSSWFPKLPWDPPQALEAAVALTERYLKLNAPATPADIAHFFGARVSDAREWLQRLVERKTIEVECGSRKGLLALRKDASELSAAVPPKKSEWPTQLLPMWDAHLMGHKDKSWVAPKTIDQKRIWKSAAVVQSIVLHRGRAVATWSQKRKGKRVECSLEPLSGWSKTTHGPAYRRGVKELAQHLEMEATALL